MYRDPTEFRARFKAYKKGKIPYDAGRPMPPIRQPNLIEIVEDSQWKPQFGSYKNGKLPKYEDGTELFVSELDWSPLSWFSKRVAKPDGTLYDEKEAAILKSHVPEYLWIEQNAKSNGTWLNMPNGKKWEGDPRSWVMMQSQAYKKNYQSLPWYTGLAEWNTQFDYGEGRVNTNKLTRAPYYNGLMWFSDNKQYGDTFAHYIDSNGKDLRDYIESEKNIVGKNFLSAIPIEGNYRKLQPPKTGTFDYWQNMPYEKVDNQIQRLLDSDLQESFKHEVSNPELLENLRKDRKQVLTDDVVNWSKDLGDQGVFLYNVNDGPVGETDDNGKRILFNVPVINEFISQPGFTDKIKFIEGNTGDFDINNPYKYAYVPRQLENGLLHAKNGKSPIHIKPANRGKFTALKKRTGHSASWFKKNGTPAQKKMATFALNAKKWHYADGKLPEYGNGTDALLQLAKGGVSMIPGAGTLIDGWDFYNDPSLENLGYLALSGIGDAAIFTGIGAPFGFSLKAIKSAAKLNKTRKTLNAVMSADKAGNAILLYDAKKAYNASKAASRALAAETGNLVDTAKSTYDAYTK